MKKLFSILALTVLFTAFAVAQTSDGFAKENVGITDSDCKNFAKNYKKIQKALEDLNEKYDEGAIPAGTELDTYNKVFERMEFLVQMNITKFSVFQMPTLFMHTNLNLTVTALQKQ